MTTLLTLAVAALVSVQPASPPEQKESYFGFSPVLSAAEWRLWVDECASSATPVENLDARVSKARAAGAAAEPGDVAKGGVGVGLPEYSVWGSGPRECWLTTRSTVVLRRVSEGSYAAMVIASQETRTIVVGCSATERDGRVVFDRWVPWGACREARVRIGPEGVLELEPVAAVKLSSEGGGIHIPSQRLGLMNRPSPAGPDVLDAQEWLEWTERALRSTLSGLAAGKAAVWKDGMFVFERADGLRWWVADPRLNTDWAQTLANVAEAKDEQLLRILKRTGKEAPALPSPPAGPIKLDGEWVDCGDSGRRIYLKSCGWGKVAVLEFIADPRAAQQLEGTVRDGRVTVKKRMTSGVKRLVPSEVDGELVLVNDGAETLLDWNEKPAERMRLSGVWRRMKAK